MLQRSSQLAHLVAFFESQTPWFAAHSVLVFDMSPDTDRAKLKTHLCEKCDLTHKRTRAGSIWDGVTIRA
jgi:hypothetical protein